MLSTQHLLVGAVIVKTIPEPIVALPLAFLSHFVLDSIPHWDGSPRMPMKLRTVSAIALEYAFGAILVFILTSDNTKQTLILLGAFLGTLPDFLTGIYRVLLHFFPKLSLLQYPLIKVPNDFHIALQRNIPFIPGLGVSTLTTLTAILILIRFE